MTDRELMQQALYALQESKPININDPTAFYRSAHAIEALRARLAQPEQEDLAQLEQAMIEAWKPIPQREWQGLTDEEIFAVENSVPDAVITDRDWCVHFARAIEAKLKEKNS